MVLIFTENIVEQTSDNYFKKTHKTKYNLFLLIETCYLCRGLM